MKKDRKKEEAVASVRKPEINELTSAEQAVYQYQWAPTTGVLAGSSDAKDTLSEPVNFFSKTSR